MANKRAQALSNYEKNTGQKGNHTECTSDYTERTSNHTECTSNYTECTSDHTECTSNHTECTSDHTECTSNHTECTSDHTECTSNHTECTSDHTECTSNYTECTSKNFTSTAKIRKGLTMNLQQFEYVLAVDKHRHFVKAAEHCFITQATLSMMIKKLEDELSIKIFDRSQQPVKPTKEGEAIIQRIRQIWVEVNGLKDFANELNGEITGDLHLAIIPTLAPYLLPMFIQSFTALYPHLKVYIKEMLTDDMLRGLKEGTIDIGIAATPLQDTQMDEHHLFYEEFFGYAAKEEKLSRKKYLLAKEISLQNLWLLEEGHCLRNQVLNLCELKKLDADRSNIHYAAGSIETLVNMVDSNGGITIVPELAIAHLSATQKANLLTFAEPKPVREISMITLKDFPRKKLLLNLQKEIQNSLPVSKASGKSVVVSIN